MPHTQQGREKESKGREKRRVKRWETRERMHPDRDYKEDFCSMKAVNAVHTVV